MKKIVNKRTGTFLLVVLTGISITACDKDGINDYMPERPVGGYSSSKEIASTSLAAYWAFDGHVNDSVANLTGTPTNTTFITGIKGQALKVNSNGYVVYNNAGTLPGLQSFTISFWMNTPQYSSNARGIFSMNNNKDFWGGLDIYMEPYVQNNVPNPDTAFMKIHLNNDNVTWKGQFTDFKVPAAIGKWVHIASTYDAGTSVYNVYVNGRQIGVNTAANPANTKGPALRGDDPATGKLYGPIKFVNANALVFGTFQFQTSPSLTTGGTPQPWAASFEGALDEFRIYNKALPDTDVNALYKLESLGR